MEDVPYARILREGWLLVLIVALLGAGGAYGIAKLLPETYASTSTLMLQVDSKEASLFERNQFSLARIRSYPELVDSPEVIAGIRSDLHLSAADYSDRDLRKMVSADNTTDTVLLVVRAEAPTAQLSAAVANAAAAHLSKLIQSTENSDADERYQVNLTVVLPAVEPLAPVSPQTLAIVGLGLIVGLAVGGIVAVYRTVTNRNVITISDVRRLVGIRVVGRIPRRRRWRRSDDEDESVAFDETVANLGVLGGSDLSSVLVLTASTMPSGRRSAVVWRLPSLLRVVPSRSWRRAPHPTPRPRRARSPRCSTGRTSTPRWVRPRAGSSPILCRSRRQRCRTHCPLSARACGRMSTSSWWWWMPHPSPWCENSSTTPQESWSRCGADRRRHRRCRP
jgi:capsular polysaccharide biosynthesis protein